MTNDEAIELAKAESTKELSLALGGLASRPHDFVVATPGAVFVGGDASATIAGKTYRHTGDGTFTRHDLAAASSGAVVVPVATPPVEASPVEAPPPVPPSEVEVTRAPLVEAPSSEPPAEAPALPHVDRAPTVPPRADFAAMTPPVPGTAAPIAPDRVVSLEPEQVLVRGLMCQRDHLVHPEARMCPLCGDNMQNRSIVVNSDGSVGDLGPRPPLGVVILPDGRSYQLERTTIVGRAPEVHPDVVAGTADAIRVDDHELSRAHLRFVLNDWQVMVEDLGSTNGSWLGTGPSARQLQPESPLALRTGGDIYAGTSVLNYQPTSAAQS